MAVQCCLEMIVLPLKSDDGFYREPESGPSFSEDEGFLQLKAMFFTDKLYPARLEFSGWHPERSM